MVAPIARQAGAAAPDGAGMVTLIERSIVLLLVVGLLVGVAAVLRPFTTAILFGTTLAIAAWRLRQALIARGLPRGLAAAILLLLALLVVALPVLAVAPAMTSQLGSGIQRVQAYFATAPERPAWFAGVPLLGARLARVWDEVARAGGNLHAMLEPYSGTLQQTLLTAAQALADSVLQVVLSLVVATMLWTTGDRLAEELRDIFRRLGGVTAEATLDAVAGAVRGVALGVIGTAMIQAALLAFGLAVAGVPGAATLGFVGLLLAISQVGGPLLILIWGGAAWWLFGQDHGGWGVFMIAWGVLVSTIDNFLKPWLIGLGVHMPMSLTILGVFGGFVAFGFLGLFIGPALLAAALILLRSWRANAPLAV
ncbi:AI-2E family transporter [Rhodopila globiformis]|uniref:AI-2E family transporter n=1 Tax=Rhodopila globiformis TaxID=1071 RepID=UPI00130483EF|nr:AI-2E family transporter [Rhodopila globiformis]